MFDVTISNPLSAERLANESMVSNPLPVLNAAWTGKVSRSRPFMVQAGGGNGLLPVPISTLGGRQPEAHCVVLSIASDTASRAMVAFAKAPSILFQRHAALLDTSNGSCLLSGCSTNAQSRAAGGPTEIVFFLQ